MMALADKARASQMGAEAYRLYWVNPHTIQAHTKNLLTVYRTVLERHWSEVPPVGHA
jgi:hypothetical protein